MAGGMHPKRDTLTLAERSALAGVRQADSAPEPTARHCWVTGLRDHPGRWPGLLLEWRRVGGSVWQGRVVYAVDDGRQTVLVEEWLSGGYLEPAVSGPARPS